MVQLELGQELGLKLGWGLARAGLAWYLVFVLSAYLVLAAGQARSNMTILTAV